MISIVIPTFNRKDFLLYLLSHLLVGNSYDFQCVIIDDCSDDGTFQAIKRWQASTSESRILCIRNDVNRGAPVARNKGINASTGEFILFMDSDDLACPKGILRLRDHLFSNPNLDYCYGIVKKTGIDAYTSASNEYIGRPYNGSSVGVAGYHWHTMGALYRRNCIEQVGLWNEKLTGSQDWEYQSRVKLFGGNGEFVSTLVGYWRQHESPRVGTSIFRLDYSQSFIVAANSVLHYSRMASRCDSKLESRIAARLLLCALELGENGYFLKRQSCLNYAQACLSSNPVFSILLSLAYICPSFLDPYLMWTIKASQFLVASCRPFYAKISWYVLLPLPKWSY